MPQRKPLFMSAEHIALMNTMLKSSEAVKAECARLPGDLAVAFVLSDGPERRDVHWRMECSRRDGVAMGLGLPARPADVTVRSDYGAMIQASQGARAGAGAASPMKVDGDPALVAQVLHVLGVARAAGVVDVEFPKV